MQGNISSQSSLHLQAYIWLITKSKKKNYPNFTGKILSCLAKRQKCAQTLKVRFGIGVFFHCNITCSCFSYDNYVFGLTFSSDFKFNFTVRLSIFRASASIHNLTTNTSRLGIKTDLIPSQMQQTSENHPGGPGCSKWSVDFHSHWDTLGFLWMLNYSDLGAHPLMV